MTAGRLAAACARDAVAVELLLTCSMRVGNLVDLRLGETIRRFGEGARGPLGDRDPGRRRSRTASRCASSCRPSPCSCSSTTWPLARALVRARLALAVPQRAGRACRRPAALGQHRPARPAPCRRPDHLPPVPPPRRRALPEGGPERAGAGEPASRPPRPQHHPPLLRPRADQGRHPALPRGPRAAAGQGVVPGTGRGRNHLSGKGPG